jgi:hypothetical protein
MQLGFNHEDGHGLSRHAHFGSFWPAFLLLVRALTGENIQVRGAA